MKAKVKVFEQPSRGDNMIIKIIPNEKFASDSIPADCLGETVYVGWPHLVEAKYILMKLTIRFVLILLTIVQSHSHFKC